MISSCLGAFVFYFHGGNVLMLNIENAKYASWLQECNFGNCKLNRTEYGQFIADYITGEHDGFVLNLNGGWGSGKTEFLKRLYSELLTRHYPVIYIDAWESDFSKSPLTVVTSELLNQLEAFNKDICNTNSIREIKQFCGKFLQSTAVAISGIATAKLLNDPNIGTEFAKGMLEDSPERYIDKLSSEYQEQAEAIREIRSKLSLLASDLEENFGANLPVIVLIDELDRCRPTYAIEMLEAIKHFFKTDNFVFVVATDTEQLCHSITAVYGDKFDSKQYLKRFFDRKAALPSPDLDCYLNALDLDFTPYVELELYPRVTTEPYDGFNKYIIGLAQAYELEIRDVDQLVNKFFSCLRTALRAKETTNKEQYINVLTLLVALVEFDKGRPEFYRRGNNNPEIYDIKHAVPFFESADFDILIDISLKLSIRYDKKIENPWGDSVIADYPDASKLIEYSDEKFYRDSNFRSWKEQLTRVLQLKTYAKTSNIKYWLWEDYKRVVELAGNLF